MVLKEQIERFLRTLGHFKVKIFGKNKIVAPAKISLTSQVKHSKFLFNNAVGRRSVVHHSVIDAHSYLGEDCRIILTEIGKFCSIGSSVKTSFASHPVNFVSTHPSTYSVHSNVRSFVQTESFRNNHSYTENGCFVTIGNDVWIGDNVSIFDGVTIGDGAIIGTNSLVIKAVPPYSIVAGNPAKLIRYRFSRKQIALLTDTEWWNLPESELKKLANENVFGVDIEKFASRVKKK
tara:strand:+ start:372 stop:1073 length:702 start_codon:yes stop_codon:yes gene_type:complete